MLPTDLKGQRGVTCCDVTATGHRLLTRAAAAGGDRLSPRRLPKKLKPRNEAASQRAAPPAPTAFSAATSAFPPGNAITTRRRPSQPADQRPKQSDRRLIRRLMFGQVSHKPKRSAGSVGWMRRCDDAIDGADANQRVAEVLIEKKAALARNEDNDSRPAVGLVGFGRIELLMYGPAGTSLTAASGWLNSSRRWRGTRSHCVRLFRCSS